MHPRKQSKAGLMIPAERRRRQEHLNLATTNMVKFCLAKLLANYFVYLFSLASLAILSIAALPIAPFQDLCLDNLSSCSSNRKMETGTMNSPQAPDLRPQFMVACQQEAKKVDATSRRCLPLPTAFHRREWT